MICTKGEPGTGDVVQAVRHMRAMNAEIRLVQNLREAELSEDLGEAMVGINESEIALLMAKRGK